MTEGAEKDRVKEKGQLSGSKIKVSTIECMFEQILLGDFIILLYMKSRQSLA